MILELDFRVLTRGMGNFEHSVFDRFPSLSENPPLPPQVAINCQATGDPVPSITWENACTGELPRSRVKGSNGSQLSLKSLQTEDSGRYFCVATSEFLQTRTVFELKIKTGQL